VRRIAVVALLLLSSCAEKPVSQLPPDDGTIGPDGIYRPSQARVDEYERQIQAPRAANPQFAPSMNQRQFPPIVEQQISAREAELLERAMTASPDYAQALRRAAVANIDEAPPVPRERPQARYQRIEAEEARLSDLVERRRREHLAQRGQQDRAAQAAAARGACDAQALAVGAGIYTPYSPRTGVLGSALAGAINSSAAEEQARIGCYRAYGF
jgi:hypothetical protein